MFGRMMNETLGKIHFWLTFIFFNCTFFPMHMLGMHGHMRRIYDPTQYDFLKPFQPMNQFITYSAFALFAVQFIFAMNFILQLVVREEGRPQSVERHRSSGIPSRRRRTGTSIIRPPCITDRTSSARRSSRRIT